MLRQLHRHSIWQGKHLPPAGVELDRTHPRAKDLLGLWVPHSPGLYGTVYDSPGTAPVKMRDLSPHRRDGHFNRGPIGGQTPGKWVVDRAGPGFFLDGGQYGRFDVTPTRAADWNFQGAFTFMCRVRLNVLVTADGSARVFVGRSDGGGPLDTKWGWAWCEHDILAAGTTHRIIFRMYENGGVAETVISTATWDPTVTDIYTVAVTRGVDKTFTFYLDGHPLGVTVSSTSIMPIPISTDLSWSFGEDFGFNLAGTFFWMKAWKRDLLPREVAAGHASPWEMLSWRLGISGFPGVAAGPTRAWAYVDEAMLMGIAS